MFISVKKVVLVVLLLCIMASYPGLYGQEPIDFFNRGDYRSALAGFRELKESQPQNALYTYYAGRCLVELNQELDDAIEWLYSVSRKQVPDDVLFYLGRAYHRNYDFTEAIKYYARYEVEASKQEARQLKVKHHIKTCRSALGITSTFNQYEVMAVTFIDLSDSVQFSQVRMKGGQLQRKPPQYFRGDEDREGLGSLMFMPYNPLRGDFAFYSGIDRSGKNGAQLYRVKKGAGKAWGDPAEIKSLNTEGDEILPYFDPIENDLYFASDGRQGIGGFDLYKSHYDVERDEWSDPINLGFPVNSVMDEYLVLPGTDLGMLMFFSSRRGSDSTVAVYRVHLVEPKKSTNGNDPEMLREVASLGHAASEILAEIATMSERPGPALKETRVKKPEITKVTILPTENKEDVEKSAYQETLARALMHQASSDSLKDLATSARLKVRESGDPNDRWVWQKQIMVWEKKAGDEEELADALYAKIERADSATSGKKPSVNIPESIEVDRVVNELTVYRYKEEEMKIEGEPGTQPGSGKLGSDHATNRFDILSGSPYSEKHPIPVDVAIPDGVFYRIQLGAFGQAVTPDYFEGISPVTAETISDRGLIKYYAGKFTRYNDASLALVRIRSKGYEDAFIVSWYHGEPVSTQKAKQLE